jgi:hypothetical protein
MMLQKLKWFSIIIILQMCFFHNNDHKHVIKLKYEKKIKWKTTRRNVKWKLVTKLKPNINSVEVHPQLSNKGHPVDGVLVGAGSLGAILLFRPSIAKLLLCNEA